MISLPPFPLKNLRDIIEDLREQIRSKERQMRFQEYKIRTDTYEDMEKLMEQRESEQTFVVI